MLPWVSRNQQLYQAPECRIHHGPCCNTVQPLDEKLNSLQIHPRRTAEELDCCVGHWSCDLGVRWWHQHPLTELFHCYPNLKWSVPLKSIVLLDYLKLKLCQMWVEFLTCTHYLEIWVTRAFITSQGEVDLLSNLLCYYLFTCTPSPPH